MRCTNQQAARPSEQNNAHAPRILVSGGAACRGRSPRRGARSPAGAALALGIGLQGATVGVHGSLTAGSGAAALSLGDPPTSGGGVPAPLRSVSRAGAAAGYTVVSFLQGPVRMLPVLSAPYGTVPWSSPFWPGPPQGRDCVLRTISKWAGPRAASLPGRGGQP